MVGLNAGTPPNHSWHPSTPTNPYQLDDIDGFDLGDYNYCKWGVLQSSDIIGSNPLNQRANLSFTWLTYGPYEFATNTDLFLSTSLTSLQSSNLLQFSTGTWTAPVGTGDGKVDIDANDHTEYHLFRKLHFSNTLYTQSSTSLPSDAEKVIVLIHGWNPDSNSYAYGLDGDEFDKLYKEVKAKIAGTGWHLVLYHWEEDADTGGALVFNLHGPDAINPSEAATIGHLHGQHLGRLLESFGSLRQVHFIAHSAGSWVARSATRHLLQRTNKQVQVTLLDPFIPGVMKNSSGANNNTPLDVSAMDGLSAMDIGPGGQRSGQLYWLENDYAQDVDVRGQIGAGVTFWDVALATDWVYNATSQTFSWGEMGWNQRVDWSPGGTPQVDAAMYFDHHAGPIDFYYQTVIDPDGSRLPALKNSQFSLSKCGWRKSMFLNEPVIEGEAPLTVSAGKSATLALQINTRYFKLRGLQANDFKNFKWQKLTSGGAWADVTVQAGKIDQNNLPSLVIKNAQVADAGSYRLSVTRDLLTETSDPVVLSITGTTTTPPPATAAPATPSDLAAVATSSSSVSLSWTNHSTNETGIRIQRRLGTSGAWGAWGALPGQTADKPAGTRQATDSSGLVAGTIYYYRVAAVNSINTAAPAYCPEAYATTKDATAAGGNYTLTLNSVNPVSGVAMPSYNGLTGGSQAQTTSPGMRSFAAGTLVNVSCPQSLPSGQQFQKWRIDEVDAYTPAVHVTMNGNHTVTTVYGSGAPSARTLTGLSVNGPSSVGEGSSGLFTATAFFNDGGSQPVTPAWHLTSGAPATISASGTLDAGAVTSDTPITVFASYTVGGVTQTATKNTTITDTHAVQTYTLTLQSSNPDAGGVTASPMAGNSTYPAGTLVRLTAYANYGYHFTGFSGDTGGTAATVTVVMDRNKTVTGNFTTGDPRLGALMVTIQPPEAVAAGVKWGLSEGNYRDSGTSYTSDPSSLFLVVKPVDGWLPPAGQQLNGVTLFGPVTVTAGKTSAVTITMTQDATPGLLNVTLTPPAAAAAGARWHLNGGAAQASGASNPLAQGSSYSITFDGVSGWSAPNGQVVTVTRGQTTFVTGNYAPAAGTPSISSVHPGFGALAGGTVLTIEGINLTGTSSVMIGGKPATNVTVAGPTQVTCITPSSTVYGTAPVVLQTPSGSATSDNGFAYGLERGSGIELVTALGGQAMGVAVQGSYSYLCEGSSLVVVNTASPNSPAATGRLALPGAAQAIALSGQYAFIADGDAGVQVVDISTPATPVLKGYYATPGLANGIAILAGRAYVADRTAGLVVLDLASPTRPSQLSSINFSGAGAVAVAVRTTVQGTFAYLCSTSGYLQIVDVTAPASPQLRGSLYSNSGNLPSLALYGNYALMPFFGGLHTVDVTNPDAPADLGAVPNVPASSVAVINNLVYATGAWLSIISYSGATPTVLSQTTSLASYGYGPVVIGSRAYLPGGTNGLQLVDVSNSASPVLTSAFKDSSACGNWMFTALAGNTLCAVVNTDFEVLDVSNANQPVITGQLSGIAANANYGSPIVAKNGLAFIHGDGVNSNHDSTRIIDVSTPASPQLKATVLASVIQNYSMALDGNVLYVAGQIGSRARFAAIDVSNPSSPVVRSNRDLTAPGAYTVAISVAVKGGKTAVGIQGDTNQVSILDVSDPASPVERGSITTVGYPADLQWSADGRYVYVADLNKALHIVDVSDVNHPVETGKVQTVYAPRSVTVQGSLLYVAAWGPSPGVYVFDVSDPALPVMTKSYPAPAQAQSVACMAGTTPGQTLLYVADTAAGLLELKTKDVQAPQVTITGPVSTAAYATATGSLDLAGTAADNDAVTHVAWSNSRGGGGDAAGTTSWTAPGIALAPGVNVITVSAQDRSGNTGTAVLTVTYTPPDAVAPTISITLPGTAPSITTHSSTVDVQGIAADNTGVTRVTWSSSRGDSGTAAGTAAWSTGALVLQPGPNTITVTARDAAGNTATDAITLLYIVPDTAPPTAAITFPTLDPGYATSSATLSLAGIAADENGIAEVRWANDRGGQGTAAGGDNWSVGGIALQPGLNVLTITARDAAGNTATDSLTVNCSAAGGTTRPFIAISAPSANARLESETITAEGAAAGVNGVTAVLCQLNDGPWLPATGTSAWSTSLQPPPGLNTLRAKCLDLVGAESLVVVRTFTRVLKAGLVLTIAGNGTVSHPGFTSAAGLEVGKNYVLTAVPKPGYIFAGYSGSIVSDSPSITITMQPGMAVTASFIANPFTAVAGTYLGLVQGAPATQASSGLLRIAAAATGSFTGTLSLGGAAYSLAGKFSSTGQWVGQVARSKKTPLTLLLMLDVAGGSDTLSGLVSDGVFTSSINTGRSTFKAGHACPWQGRYTIAIDPEAGNPAAPAPCGYATFTVDAGGNTVLAGKLGDGTALSSSAFATTRGTWPLYAALYASTGCVTGDLAFAALTDSDAAGDLYWYKPQRLADAYFKPGFEARPHLAAQAYLAPALHHRALPDWDAVNGLGMVGVSGAGLITSSLTQPITLTIDNKVISSATVLKSLVVIIVPGTGTFSGSFYHPDTKKTTAHSGALLQKTDEGVGVIQGVTTTGSILLSH